jgi:hypothetical protein
MDNGEPALDDIAALRGRRGFTRHDIDAVDGNDGEQVAAIRGCGW